MAATKRKFTVPSAEDLDGEIQVSRPKPLFKTYKKYSKSNEEKKDDKSTKTCTTNVNKRDEKNYPAARTLHTQSQKDQRIVEDTLDPNSLSKESNVEPSENNHTSSAVTSAGAGTVKSTVGKTFRETFAFLEGTSHFKETVAKIKEKEYVQLVLIQIAQSYRHICLYAVVDLGERGGSRLFWVKKKKWQKEEKLEGQVKQNHPHPPPFPSR